MYNLAYVFTNAIGKCMLGNLDDGDSNCVPLMVPAQLFERVLAAKLSLQVHVEDFELLGQRDTQRVQR